ncbi:hypothetical protein CW748_10770 [Alteromonadales bacterium alter-6D02]|nr:hypothetical protein CW748_10770 [Alteromonadales bacterium alter-6D02]
MSDTGFISATPSRNPENHFNPEINTFQLTQTLDIQQPQSAQAMAIPNSEWAALKTSVSSIEDNNSLMHTIGSALIGAGLSIVAAALFTEFTEAQKIEQIVMWAVAFCCVFCGVVSCVFAHKESTLVTKSASNVLSQMEIVESRYRDA